MYTLLALMPLMLLVLGLAVLPLLVLARTRALEAPHVPASAPGEWSLDLGDEVAERLVELGIERNPWDTGIDWSVYWTDVIVVVSNPVTPVAPPPRRGTLPTPVPGLSAHM